MLHKREDVWLITITLLEILQKPIIRLKRGKLGYLSRMAIVFYAILLINWRKKYVKAVQVSKVEEAYKEVRVTNHSTAGVPSPASGFRTGNVGTAYRLYFDIAEKTKELDVDKKTFDSIEEGMTGMLNYKGAMFYSFEEIKEKQRLVWVTLYEKRIAAPLFY